MKKFLVMMMCVIMVVCFMPTVAMAETNYMGTVEGLPEGITVVDGGTENVTVTNTGVVTLNFSPKNNEIGRYQDGWWVGFKITAPAELGISETNDIQYSNDGGKTYKSFWQHKDSVDPLYMTFWVPITTDTYLNFLNAGKTMNWTYLFKWNGDNGAVQTVKISIDPKKLCLKSETGEELVAFCGTKGYTSLKDAVNAVENDKTITLIKDVTNAEGIKVPSGKNFTLDFAEHTYTLTGPGAGSSGTETNAFQLLKDSNIIFKDGTIRIAEGANRIKRIIQNYADLTLENMQIYAENQVDGEDYPLSFNNGNIVFSGNTSVITTDNDTVAFDVYYWAGSYPNGTSVIFDESYTGTINGKIIYDSVDKNKAALTINGNGNFGAIEKSNSSTNGQTITISGGRFGCNVSKEYLADNKYCSKEPTAADAMYLVHDHNTTCNFGHTYCPATCKDANGAEMCHTSSHYVVPPTPPTPTDNVNNSGNAGTDNASTSADLSGSTSTSNGTTSATVDKTTADKIVDKAVENKSTEVVIDATANTTTAANSTTIAQVTIPTETLGAIAEKTEADVTIKTDVAEVKMDNAAAAAVSEQAEGDTVQIIAEKVKEDATEVHFELKVVCSDGKVISDFKGGNVAVTVALPNAMADKKVVCVYIDDNGHMSKVAGQKNADGTYTFNTGHFSSYAIMAEEEADAAIAAQKEAIKNIKIKLTSKQVKTKAGKKAVKITWTADAGDKVLDGVEVFRSTERYKGYGTEPFYTSTKGGNTGSYTNTKSLKKGTKYYYRVRGYVLVDGQKVYTDYSTKAWRTVK